MEAGGAPRADGRAAGAQGPTAAVETVRGREAFLKLKAAWDRALVAGPDPSPALEHDLLRLWLESFAPSSEPLALLAREGGQLEAGLVLRVDGSTVDGVPVRLARGLANAHSTRGGLLLGARGAQALGAVVRQALALPWDVLELRDVPCEGGLADQLAQALQEQGCTVASSRPMQSPYVPLPASREELEKRLDSHFRQNLRRRRRRLEEHGPVALEVVTGLDGLDAALEDAFAIEASGWKGREGSAIRARPETVGFYAGWARLLAREGRLRLCFLRVGDERVAFHFGHVTRGRYYLPKCAYSERYADQSPGQLLMAEVLERCIGERLESFEFLGFSMAWKREWTPLVRPHVCLAAFRPTWRGRAARLMRTQVRPQAVALWRRWRPQPGRGAP